MPTELLTIGEVARRTGMRVSGLRYYEQIGLMPPVPRVSGHRRYPASAVERIGAILLLRELGFSLREIRELMASPSDPVVGWGELARHKIGYLEERIAKAEAARSALIHSLDCPHADLLDCSNFAAAVEARLAGMPLEMSHPH